MKMLQTNHVLLNALLMNIKEMIGSATNAIVLVGLAKNKEI